MRTADQHLSELALERWLAGELAGEVTAPGAHLSRCAVCQARHRHRSDERSAFAGRADLDALAEATWRRAGSTAPRRRPRLLRLGGFIAAAGVAAALIVAVRDPAPGALRAKGGLELELFIRHPDGTVASMEPDGAAAPGDRLRFRVGAPRDGFVGVVSVDGAAGVTGYVPAAGPLPAVEVGTHLLDGAVELDAVLGRERLLAFLCWEPLATATVVAGVRGALAAAGGDPTRLDSSATRLPCTFTSFWFRKVRRP